jgi:hypothetical protein
LYDVAGQPPCNETHNQYDEKTFTGHHILHEISRIRWDTRLVH